MRCFLSPSHLRAGSTSARFRCQDWYDAGNAPVAAEISYRWAGKPLQKTVMASKPLIPQAKAYAAARANASTPIARARKTWPSWPQRVSRPRRRCDCCSGVIRTWRNRHQVSQSVRFCSDDPEKGSQDPRLSLPAQRAKSAVLLRAFSGNTNDGLPR